MNFLIDTHALIWFITDNDKLPYETKKVIEDIKNNCFVSIASYWEIAIKYSIGRLEFNTDPENLFEIIELSGFENLPITTRHILKNACLSFYHQDPFDRILIAQSLTEDIQLITKDSQFDKYRISTFWKK